jgi:hypothetical protein
MFKLNYRLSKEWNYNTQEINLCKADEISLRYTIFLGDVDILIGSENFGTNFGWVPVIDFALALKFILKKLAKSIKGEERFDFTESNANIRFIREGENIIIIPSYLSNSGKISFDEFSFEISLSAIRLKNELSVRFPDLNENPLLEQLLII